MQLGVTVRGANTHGKASGLQGLNRAQYGVSTVTFTTKQSPACP